MASGPLAWLGLASPLLLSSRSCGSARRGGPGADRIGTLSPAVAARPPGSQPLTTPPRGRGFDRGAGSLELWSPIHRADWVADGVLWYRDEPYRLASSARGARLDLPFGRLEARRRRSGDAADAAGEPAAAVDARPPTGLARSTVATALACLRARDLQEAWARRIDVRPVLLTILGAGAECCGALINLQSGAGAGSSVALTVNLIVLVEGVARFALLVGSGRPTGSLLGLALRPLLARLLDDASPDPGS